jgi:hypothetical protein
MKRKSCAFMRIMLVLVCGIGLLMHSSIACAQDLLATGTPTSFLVTVTKVELWNGSSWVEIFSGNSQLELVAGGTFDGISDLNLPAGTYSKIGITIINSFPVQGSVQYLGTTYYTTPFSVNGEGEASFPTIDPGQQGPYTFYNPDWGSLNAEYTLPELDIDPPVTVDASTDYQPILRFSIANILGLYSFPDEPAPESDANGVEEYFITLSPSVGVTIILP